MEERKQAAIENQDYQASDPWEEAVLTYCAGLEEVTTPQVLLDACHVDLENQDKRSQMRVANILKANGWGSARRSAHGIKRRIWFPLNLVNEVGQVVTEDTQSNTAVGGQPQGQPQGQPRADLGVKHENSESEQHPSRDGDNLPHLPHQIPKSCTTQENSLSSPSKPSIKVGDWVEIRANGMFFGKHAIVEAIAPDEVTVKHPDWVVCQRHKPEDLKKVKV